MVELKGSEKQVKWASEIRENIMSYLNKALKILLEEIEEEGERKGRTVEERKQIHINKFNKVIDEIMNNENADFYIKNFKNIKKYGDSDSIASKLEAFGVRNAMLIKCLEKRDFDHYKFKDEINNKDNHTYDVAKLKELKGSEKQVKWASEIRNKFLKIVEIFEEAKNNLDSSAYDDEIEDIKINIKHILSDDRATFYIENLRKLNDNMIEKASERTYKERIMDTLALTNSILDRY